MELLARLDRTFTARKERAGQQQQQLDIKWHFIGQQPETEVGQSAGGGAAQRGHTLQLISQKAARFDLMSSRLNFPQRWAR